MQKRDSQKRKAIKRAADYHRLWLTDDEYETLCKKIADNEGAFLERQSLRVSKCLVKHKDDWFPVVYDRVRKSIVSFLPEYQIKESPPLARYLKAGIVSKSKHSASQIFPSKISRHLRGVISIGDPTTSPPLGFDELNCTKIRLEFHDIDYSFKNHTAPREADVKKIIDFGKVVLPNVRENQFVLTHCQAGIGRSTAAAYILRCMQMEKGEEYLAAKLLKEENMAASPNEKMIKIADKLLDRDGRMIKAVEGLVQYYWKGNYAYWQEHDPYGGR